MKRGISSTMIPLKFGERWLFARVSRVDAHLGLHFWHAIESGKKFYARKAGCVFLHRVIMAAPDDVEVDHRNGNTLDCRRSNLRLATRAQNMRNMRRPSHNTSGFKGVALTKAKRWRAFIKTNRKQTHLGVFSSKIAAARAYDRAARRIFGRFAALNFP